jgi:glutamate carboxypeptidase
MEQDTMKHRFATLALAAALTALGGPASPASLQAQATLSDLERRLADRVESTHEEDVLLLERTVNINSGTLNPAGVRAVHDVLAPEFEKLGFSVRYAELPAETGRGGHLVAERRGTRGKRLLLIGHLDTVFEPDSPFQRFEREGDTALGPGVGDMKGGNIVILSALRAMHAEGALEGTSITVVLTGDEEAPGRPLEVARHELIEAAKRSDIALGFEGGSRGVDGDYGVIARRSASSWRLDVTGTPAHSSGIFSGNTGSGAIYEMARILSRFHDELREENLTYNVGMLLGGTEVEYDEAAAGGRAFGKTNVIPETAVATGDIRTLTNDQLDRTRRRMEAIVAESLPRTQATITFRDGYPSMPPTAANEALLGQFDEVSRALGVGPVFPFDPGSRGAADISFVADHIEAGLDGLGVRGSGSHTVNERADLRSLTEQAQRAAVLMLRLTGGREIL